MKVFTQEVFIPKKELDLKGLGDLQRFYETRLRSVFPPQHRVLRFVITETNTEGYRCEFDLIVSEKEETHVILKCGDSRMKKKRTFGLFNSKTFCNLYKKNYR